MNFRIADTFTDSLSKLTGAEQKAVKTTAFDLQLNPANPGLQFHKLERTKDPRFWSVRVNRDIRLIVHRTEANLLLCYVDHHDKAYGWAERRKLETHPKTGAAQLVEVRETIKEVIVPKYIGEERPAQPKALLFEDLSDEELLKFGIPADWLDDVRRADEDSVLDLADHLPSEAAEALLDIATGATPVIPQPAAAETDPFAHPDAERRFRVMHNVDELERALDYPWEKWTVFLHPSQKQAVERDFNGPARVSGSAGTGKTIVALHRAVFLARSHPDARVLLTTFSDTLAAALKTKLRRLVSNQPRIAERLEVQAISAIGKRLYAANFGQPQLVTREVIGRLIESASQTVGEHRFSQHFLRTEWGQVVDAWQLGTWESYRDVQRLGRKTRLPEKQRKLLWSICSQVRESLAAKELLTEPALFGRVAEILRESKHPVFEFTVVDEAQDVSVAQLRFLAALGGSRANALFFAGDLGQRIFQQPFSWKSLGVDIRGRSQTLRINYRTSHQIRMQADQLLGPEVSDVDGITERRSDTISVFNGPKPAIAVYDTVDAECQAVSQWLKALIADGLQPHEIGVFVRSSGEVDRARAAIEGAGIPFKVLDEQVATTSGYASVSTMHLAKGLEFRAVAVMACDDEVIPLQERIASVVDDSDLEEVYNTERHLLYVACTRARDHLMVSGLEPVSEFLDDLGC